MSAGVVVPAAGSGQRLGGLHKAFLPIAGEPMLLHALRPFLAHSEVSCVVVVLRSEDVARPPEWLVRLDPRVRLVEGGPERGDSVRAGLVALTDDVEVVVVHDAARPLVTARTVDTAIKAAERGLSVIMGVPVADTLHEVDANGCVVATPDRRRLWHAQTPQAFPRQTIVDAYDLAARDGITATDDATLVVRYGGTVTVIEGDRENLKVTSSADLLIAEACLRARLP